MTIILIFYEPVRKRFPTLIFLESAGALVGQIADLIEALGGVRTRQVERWKFADQKSHPGQRIDCWVNAHEIEGLTQLMVPRAERDADKLVQVEDRTWRGEIGSDRGGINRTAERSGIGQKS